MKAPACNEGMSNAHSATAKRGVNDVNGAVQAQRAAEGVPDRKKASFDRASKVGDKSLTPVAASAAASKAVSAQRHLPRYKPGKCRSISSCSATWTPDSCGQGRVTGSQGMCIYTEWHEGGSQSALTNIDQRAHRFQPRGCERVEQQGHVSGLLVGKLNRISLYGGIQGSLHAACRLQNIHKDSGWQSAGDCTCTT